MQEILFGDLIVVCIMHFQKPTTTWQDFILSGPMIWKIWA